jgi:aminoglycoside phosphotransferase (APT) family kinase protein
VTRQPLNPIEMATSLGVHGGRQVRSVVGGSDTRIWRLETRDGPVAVRVFEPGQQALADREAEALAAARSGGVPVPDVVARGVSDERPVTVLEWCEGQTVLGRLLTAPRRAAAVGEAFGRAQATIHHCTAPAHWSTSRASGWGTGVGWPQRPGNGGRPVLLHLDFHPLNVLMRDETVTAVIDWVNAGAGDPRADVARTYSILRADPAVHGIDRRLLVAFRHAWRAGYEAVAGPLRDVAPFVAWAGGAMQRDLGRRLRERDARRIGAWAAGWQGRHERTRRERSP